MDYTKLTKKKNKLDKHRPLPPELAKNLDEWFTVELTYTSNAIEGNTLTRQETALVLEKGISIGGKSITEHLETTNHAKALELIKTLVNNKQLEITEKIILSLHEYILKGIDDKNTGCYRNVQVRIAGSRVTLPNPLKIRGLRAEFVAWLTKENTLHPVALAGDAHYQLVTIHPFVDGNGRTARLLMNLILHMHGYPPAIIRNEDRKVYIESLETAQLGGSRNVFDKLIFDAVDSSLDIYLQSL